MTREDIEAAIRKVFPKASQAKVDALVDELEEDQPTGAERPTGRVILERVEYPYLTVSLDGNGNAVRVDFPQDPDGGWEVFRD